MIIRSYFLKYRLYDKDTNKQDGYCHGHVILTTKSWIPWYAGDILKEMKKEIDIDLNQYQPMEIMLFTRI